MHGGRDEKPKARDHQATTRTAETPHQLGVSLTIIERHHTDALILSHFTVVHGWYDSG
jgi:hypothetical protein